MTSSSADIEIIPAPRAVPRPPTPPATPAAAAAVGPDIRTGTVVGDRACAKCAFNLTGQPILRERLYDLLIIRCPECGQAASVQEYPLLGKWANRWAMLFAGAWLIVVMAALIGTSAVFMGFGQSTYQMLASRIEQSINTEYGQAWQRVLKDNNIDQNNATQYQAFMSSGKIATFGNDFWSRANILALIDTAGGWRSGIDWWRLTFTFPWLLLLLAIGVFWAVLMTHARRIWLLLLAAIVFGGAMTFLYFVYRNTNYYGYYGYWYAGGQVTNPFTVQGYLWPRLMPGIVLAGAIPFLIGLWFGRPIARLGIRAFLPPRLRVPLSFLWLEDGLPPPRVDRKPA